MYVPQGFVTFRKLKQMFRETDFPKLAVKRSIQQVLIGVQNATSFDRSCLKRYPSGIHFQILCSYVSVQRDFIQKCSICFRWYPQEIFFQQTAKLPIFSTLPEIGSKKIIDSSLEIIARTE